MAHAQSEQVHTKNQEENGAVQDTKVKDSSVSNVENSTNDKPREKRRIEREESEEEEVDEFGRVKRRRQKFTSERDEEDDYDDHHRYSYRPRSPSPPRRRRYHRSSYYPSDSEEEDDRRRRYSRRPSYGSSRYYSSHHHSRHSRGSRNPYESAGRYIDTDFHPTKIYIGDLEDVTSDELERTFRRFGRISQVKVVEGKDFGFVTYEDKESALDAIQAMDGQLFGRRHIRVNRAKLPERNQYGFGNIPWTDEDGNLAKEEMQTYPGDLDVPYSNPSNQSSSSAPHPTIDRPLTTYDDL